MDKGNSIGMGESGCRPKHTAERTLMAQMLPKFHIPMPARCDVEIALHLVPLQAPIHAARIPLRSPSHPGSLLIVPPRLPHLPQHVRHMRVLLLHVLSTPLVPQIVAVVHFLRVHPRGPTGGVFLEQIAGKNTVAAGVLDVDVEVLAPHGDNGVEVYLEGLRDAFFDAELLGFRTGKPAAKLAEGEEEAEEREDERGVPAGEGAARVGRLCFGWKEESADE